MGSSEWKFVAGGALAAALFVGFHFMVPGPNAAALKHDHTERWSYVKVPRRAANVLERRLGEVASLSRHATGLPLRRVPAGRRARSFI
jgi:hypothetical protein